MFLDFYRMREQPFGVVPDPRFLFLGQSHREALASLFYGIEADRGFMALIAQPGLGKTTLIFQLLEKLQQTCRTVFVFQTQCTSTQLFQYILNDLGVKASGMDMASMHEKLNEILVEERLAGRRFILAIDEAQNLDTAVLETVRLLSNFETTRAKLIQIVLIGQPQLARKLSDPALLQLEQRIAMLARLEPFNLEDAAKYITHRLKVAGYDGDALFTPGALRIIMDRSQGIPRNINSLCFSALSLGCAMKRKRIDSEIMREVVVDLNLESFSRPLLAHRASQTTVRAVPALSDPSISKPWFLRWMPGYSTVAASIALAGVLLFHYMGKFGWPWGSTPGGTAKVYISAVASKPPSEAVSVSAGIPSSGVTPDEIPIATPLHSLLPDEGSDTVDIVVQSGETLRRIVLENFGQNGTKLIERIEKLNPSLVDPNHIEAGQKIRLPLLSKPVISSTASGLNDLSGENRVGKDPNE
jgi:type II secretory pathway predicted ATPase ExeA